MTSIVAVFEITTFLTMLLWAIWALLNFWIWQKHKAFGNFVMTWSAAALCVIWFLLLVSAWTDYRAFSWLSFLGFLALTAGFYLSVKHLVAARLAALKASVKSPGETPAPPKA